MFNTGSLGCPFLYSCCRFIVVFNVFFSLKSMSGNFPTLGYIDSMVERTVLDNGIRVISEHIPSAHAVSIGIWVANGSRHESAEINGIAHFIEHLLFKGTDKRSALDIAREIDSVGGVLNAFTSREYVCYYAKILDKFLPRAVDLLADIFLNSVFDKDEIEKERKVILQEISMLEDSPDDNIHDLLYQSFWRGHPLGMPILGTGTTIGGMTRDVLRDYKTDRYRSEDIIIVAAGNVVHKELLQTIGDSFNVVVPGRISQPSGVLHYEQKIEVTEKELEQIHFCLGMPALPQNHANRYEGHVLNTILGGSMSSRLFQEIREKKGLAYSAYSYISSYSDAGSMVVYAGTSDDKIDEVVEISLKELRRLKEELVPSYELESAKEQIKGNFLLSLESSDNRMTKLAKNEIYFGRNLSIEEILNGIDAVTSETLQKLSNDLINNRNFALQFIGKADTRRFANLSIS